MGHSALIGNKEAHNTPSLVISTKNSKQTYGRVLIYAVYCATCTVYCPIICQCYKYRATFTTIDTPNPVTKTPWVAALDLPLPRRTPIQLRGMQVRLPDPSKLLQHKL